MCLSTGYTHLNKKQKKSDSYLHTTIGRRKTSTAQVALHHNPNGTGTIYFNSRHISLYLQGNPAFQQTLEKPLTALGINGFYDILVKVKGGGLRGQTDAATLGISRAVYSLYQKILKKEGYLTRDPRAKERKKYGLLKARKAPQFSKR
jgi:small subunit ribosomal protein S9